MSGKPPNGRRSSHSGQNQSSITNSHQPPAKRSKHVEDPAEFIEIDDIKEELDENVPVHQYEAAKDDEELTCVLHRVNNWEAAFGQVVGYEEVTGGPQEEEYDYGLENYLAVQDSQFPLAQNGKENSFPVQNKQIVAEQRILMDHEEQAEYEDEEFENAQYHQYGAQQGGYEGQLDVEYDHLPKNYPEDQDAAVVLVNDWDEIHGQVINEEVVVEERGQGEYLEHEAKFQNEQTSYQGAHQEEHEEIPNNHQEGHGAAVVLVNNWEAFHGAVANEEIVGNPDLEVAVVQVPEPQPIQIPPPPPIIPEERAPEVIIPEAEAVQEEVQAPGAVQNPLPLMDIPQERVQIERLPEAPLPSPPLQRNIQERAPVVINLKDDTVEILPPQAQKTKRIKTRIVLPYNEKYIQKPLVPWAEPIQMARVEKCHIRHNGSKYLPIDDDLYPGYMSCPVKGFVMKVNVDVKKPDNFASLALEEEHFGFTWRLSFIPQPQRRNLINIPLECSCPNRKFSIKIVKRVEMRSRRCESIWQYHGSMDSQGDTGSSGLDADVGIYDWHHEKTKYSIEGTLYLRVTIQILETKIFEWEPKIDYSKPAMLKNGLDYSDMALEVQGTTFNVSKERLASLSDYFDLLFFGCYVESGENELELEGIESFDFQNFLEILDFKPLNDFIVEGILHIADMYQCKSIIECCEHFLLEYSRKEVKTKFQLAERYRLKKLQEDCEEKMYVTIN